MIDKFYERYKAKNIDRFFKQLLPFEEISNIALAKEVQRLCSIVSSEYIQEFDEIDLLLQHTATLANKESSQPLSYIYKTVNECKKIGVHFLPVFLASDILLTSYDHSKFDQYKALTLLCVARLTFIGTHQPKIKAICDDVRLFSLGKRENMAAYLPNIHALNLSELVHEFQKLIDEENTFRPPAQIINQLNHYRRPYEASLKFNEGFTRKAISSEFQKNGSLQVGEVKFLDEDSNNSLVEIQQLQSSSKQQYQWQKEDDSGDAIRTLNIVTDRSVARSSYAAGAINARAIKARIAKKEMSLACDISVSSNYEVGVLVNFCIEQAITNSPSSDSAKLLLIMLVTGNTCGQVKKLKAFRVKPDGIIGFQRSHSLPSQKQRAELQPLMGHTHHKYWLPLPKVICHRLRNFKFNGITESDLKDLLQHLNKVNNTHLSLTKVSGYLSQKLAHSNIDPTLVALISGVQVKTIPSLYYLQTFNLKVYREYHRYLSFLSRLHHDDRIFVDFQREPEAIKLGSPLYIDPNLLKHLFAALENEIKSENSSITSDHYHNLVTLYTQLVLSLASGYRPVTGWFGKLSHMSLLTGDYWISDKESGDGDNSRIVTLGATAIQTMKCYLHYCEKMFIICGNKNRPLSLHYKQVLDGSEHLFFYRRENEILPCTPSIYTEFIDSVFPLQPNWARHHIRSMLTEHDVDPALIYAWMGHAIHGQRCYHSFSILSRSMMRDIADIIDRHLLNLGVGARVNSWI